MSLDTLVTLSVVAAAAVYLVRKFSRNQKQGGTGCASGGGCCGQHGNRNQSQSHCCASKAH